MQTQDFSRRRALATMALFGTGLLAGVAPSRAEAPPEVTRIRITEGPFLCFAPNYVAEEFLRMEGFTEIEYARLDISTTATVARLADFGVVGAPALLPAIDRGLPISTLAGIHVGCWEFFASDRVRAVRDLRGRRIAVGAIDAPDHVFVASILAYVGINPRRDVQWVLSGSLARSMAMFEAGEVDAFLAFPPQPQDLHARKVGHVLIDTTRDRPWAHYFCCMLTARREFVEKHPFATKRALRAILRAADVCAEDPARAARLLAKNGFETRTDLSESVLKTLRYDAWREVHPADTIRFHANRLHEAGLIRMTPQRILDQGCDWRFLDELRREMKV